MSALPKTIPAFLLHFMRKQKGAFLLLMLAPATHFLEYSITPYALKWLLDILTEYSGPKEEIFHAAAAPIALYFGVWLLWIVIWRWQEWVYTRAFPKFQADIRMEAFTYTKGHSYQYFSDHFAGSIASKVADLARSSSIMLDFIRWRLIGAAGTIIVGVGMMGYINPIFAAIMLVWLVVQLGVALLMAHRVDRAATVQAANRTSLNGQIVDVLTNITTMRLFARRSHEEKHIAKYQAVELKSNTRTLREMWKVRLAMEVPAYLMAAALMLGLIKGWQQGWVSVGDIVFVLVSGFNILGMIWQLGTELPTFFGEMGTLRQALTLITKPQGVKDAPEARPLKVTKGEIRFEKVSFHYVKGRNIFRDKSIIIPPGQKVGLVGFSGSGKSTFVNLILRFYDVESGRLLIDGQDIARVTQDSLRGQISMIPQDTSLFHRTLMENIRYGRPNASDSEVIAASKQAHCHEFVKELKDGYKSLVGERGIKLSGGQRQRIAIARAILKDAPILILDEATSALDSVTEKYIQKSLKTLMKDRTTIVIAHRLSTLSGMDRILVFKDGQIIEDGTHAQLLKKKGGHYAMLWKMQSSGFLPEM